MIPKTTTIGSYPTFPSADDVESYLAISSHGLGEDVVDPYLWAIDEALADFTSAGIEVPSTGQGRGDLYSLFLEPRFVRGIRWNGAEAFVEEKISRISSIRLSDVLHARSELPAHYQLKEPITDVYTLARFAKIATETYRDTRELAHDINKKIVIPEIEDLQESGAVSSDPAGLAHLGRRVLRPRVRRGALRGDRERGEAAHRAPRLRRRRGSSRC